MYVPLVKEGKVWVAVGLCSFLKQSFCNFDNISTLLLDLGYPGELVTCSNP